MRSKTLFLALLLTASVFGVSQKSTPTQPELESGTIESQISYIIEKSSSFKDFQLIRKTSILKVKDNIMDTLKTINASITSGEKETAQLKTQISGLQNQIKQLEAAVAEANVQIDSVNVFGNPVEKTLYNSIMWGTVLVLVLILIFFALRFKSSNAATKKTRYQLEKVEGEFEEYRKKSLKKEQEIMRKLQDEINKNNP